MGTRPSLERMPTPPVRSSAASRQIIEVRIHGRGGQGAVIASEALALAAFAGGYYVQAFPSFGVERRGAPVTAFTRISTHPINVRCQIYTPDYIIALDSMLLQAVDITAGFTYRGWILINSPLSPECFGLRSCRVATVDASAIAIKHRLGPRTTPIVNTAILGAFVRISKLASLQSLQKAVAQVVPVNIQGNLAATEEAYERVFTSEPIDP